MKFNFMLLISVVAACVSLQANESTTTIRIAASNGNVDGQIFAKIGEEKAPLVGKIALTDKDGKAIATSQSDENGKFSFENVKPGTYKAVGISGDYIGNADVEVLQSAVEEEGEEPVFSAIPLAVAPAPSPQIYEAFQSFPAAQCSQCSSSPFQSGPAQSFVIRNGGGGTLRAGAAAGTRFNFRRLALIGAAAAIPIALSGGADDPATPDGG